MIFTVAPLPPVSAGAGPSTSPPASRDRPALESVTLPPPPAAPADLAAAPAETRPSGERPLRLEPNSRATPRDAFTALIATPEISASILVVAALLAAALGAFTPSSRDTARPWWPPIWLARAGPHGTR